MKTTLLGAIVMTPLVLLGSGPAFAGTDRVNDPRNDVIVSDPDTHELSYARGNPDIAGLRLRHTSSRVVARLTFHRLGPAAAVDVNYEVYLDTDSGAGDEYILAYRRHDNRRNGVYSADPARTRKICDMQSQFHPAHDVVTFSTSRRCLANPHTVKVSGAMTMNFAGPRGEREYDYDNLEETKRVPPA